MKLKINELIALLGAATDEHFNGQFTIFKLQYGYKIVPGMQLLTPAGHKFLDARPVFGTLREAVTALLETIDDPSTEETHKREQRVFKADVETEIANPFAPDPPQAATPIEVARRVPAPKKYPRRKVRQYATIHGQEVLRCYSCGNWKDVETGYYKNSACLNGHVAVCKDCSSEKTRQRDKRCKFVDAPKKCRICGRVKDAKFFHRDYTKTGGLNSACGECVNLLRREKIAKGAEAPKS